MYQLYSLKMSRRNSGGLSLIELLISVCIFALVLIAFSNIDIFTRHQVSGADRRAKLQNEASYVLERMTKDLTGTGTSGGAVGTYSSSPVRAFTVSSTNKGIAVRVSNIVYGGTTKEIGYTYVYDSANPTDPAKSTYQILFYPDASVTTPCPGTACSALTEINSATGFSYIRPDFTTTTTQPTYYSYSSTNNYIEVQLTACWNPTLSTCGTPDNPSVKIKNRIYMPAVATY
ncbi:MAG: hypothetical protein PHW54_02905 [Candidatus Omnitrophica bacterium]|nr:hypothetical protein [Candidatus Omnitrophota bacterium]